MLPMRSRATVAKTGVFHIFFRGSQTNCLHLVSLPGVFFVPARKNPIEIIRSGSILLQVAALAAAIYFTEPSNIAGKLHPCRACVLFLLVPQIYKLYKRGNTLPASFFLVSW